MSDVSDMLFEFYKANVAKAPKTHQQQQPMMMMGIQQLNKTGQTSPTSAETHEPSTIAAIATNGAAAGINAIVNLDKNIMLSKNLKSGEMLPQSIATSTTTATITTSATTTSNENASFHPRIKFTHNNINNKINTNNSTSITAIPTSVLVPVPASVQFDRKQDNEENEPEEFIDVKPMINPETGMIISLPPPPPLPSTSVIKPVPVEAGAAAALAAALLRDGYSSFQQQIRAQEILKPLVVPQVSSSTGPAVDDGNNIRPIDGGAGVPPGSTTKILENFLRQAQQQQQEAAAAAAVAAAAYQQHDDDDGDDARFDDIHLMENGATVKMNFNQSLPNLFTASSSSINSSSSTNNSNNNNNSNNTHAQAGVIAADFLSDESQKFMMAAQARALGTFKYSLSEFGGPGSSGEGSASGGTNQQDILGPNSMIGPDGEPVYECRHCGKKYRWKSTLRRHENVECGGKEPSHQCPYCQYKSKQRGNLGVHVRKHHSDLPQLASKRRSKYSLKMELSEVGGGGSATASDDSSSKLMIDCSKQM